jgi:hypothetical protein
MKRNGVPPAMVITTTVNGKPHPAIFFVRPEDCEENYDGWSLEGALAEEIIHLHSRTVNLPDGTFSPEQRLAIDEMAVKYYVDRFLRENKYEASAQIFSRKRPNNETPVSGSITLWRRVIDSIGENEANNFYFRGEVDERTVGAVYDEIGSAVKEGLVS